MTETISAFKALSDPTRVRIVRVLASGPFHVNELAEILGARQSTVSRHLRLLSEANLVTCRRSRTWAYYSLSPQDGKRFPTRLLELLAGEWKSTSNPDEPGIESALARRRRATSEFFRKSAGKWDRVRDQAMGPPAHLDRLLDWIGDEEPVLVDLGTGTGVLLERLAPRARKLIGIDASPEMLELARCRAREADLANAEFRLGALEHLPLSDHEATAMVANLVLHHVADVSEVLREIRRGLAPGGRLVIAELSEGGNESFWESIGALWPGFRPEDLRQKLESAGFAVDRQEEPAEAAQETNGSAKNADRPAIFFLKAHRIE